MALLRTPTRQGPHRGWKGASAVWFVICGWLLSGGLNLPAQTTPPPEYRIKAVFLYNFAQFVDWPTNAFPEAQTPLVIGVLGEDPFGSFLDETVRGEKVNNRPLAVQRYRRVDEIKTCHVLFISGSEANRLEQIFNGLKGRNILTVGDCDGFARRGGMIRFVNEKSKIRLKIGLETTKAANLTVSSKLLRPADIVAPGKD
ncbi:MAG TPA: YfiR family protein [Candidatus Binatia bacterium]|nr:YfiR family protein [Candidatus Binatia bacterium]